MNQRTDAIGAKAREHLYADFPLHFRWDNTARKWKERKRVLKAVQSTQHEARGLPAGEFLASVVGHGDLAVAHRGEISRPDQQESVFSRRGERSPQGLCAPL